MIVSNGHSNDAKIKDMGNDGNYQLVQFDNLKVYCRNIGEAGEIFREIFIANEYEFFTSNPEPLIIDCGSHIGLSVLYFKKTYPKAKIIAFEPDPVNFDLLNKNIELNGLVSVISYNLAVNGIDGRVSLYGEFTSSNPRASGNSIIQSWANPGSDKIEVEAVKLSKFITQSVDFLKLDIEGAEFSVLLEIVPKLHLVKTLCVEFHGVNGTVQNLSKIEKLLKENGFSVGVNKKDLDQIFPSHLLQWAKDSGFVLAIVVANREPNLAP